MPRGTCHNHKAIASNRVEGILARCQGRLGMRHGDRKLDKTTRLKETNYGLLADLARKVPLYSMTRLKRIHRTHAWLSLLVAVNNLSLVTFERFAVSARAILRYVFVFRRFADVDGQVFYVRTVAAVSTLEMEVHAELSPILFAWLGCEEFKQTLPNH